MRINYVTIAQLVIAKMNRPISPSEVVAELKVMGIPIKNSILYYRTVGALIRETQKPNPKIIKTGRGLYGKPERK